ncbi:MAG: flagellar biosynthesis protein FlhB [Luminiphilus sp.]
MAEEQTGQERTEEPTARRLQQAREKGQVARSRELNTLLMLLPCAVALWVTGEMAMDAVRRLFSGALTPPTSTMKATEEVGAFLGYGLLSGLEMIVPFLALTVVVALLGPASMGGLIFSVQSMTPGLDKLDPIKGLGRIFSRKSLLELVKSLLKFFLVSGVAALVLLSFERQVMGLISLPVGEGIAQAGRMIMLTLILLSASLILVVAIDVPFQLWDHNRKLRMTKQEVKDEMKETDGNPEVKGKVRQKQREIADRRMLADVPTADVVITNPTHFSVALKYDQSGTTAPRVIAKGADLMAMQIRHIARANDIVIYEEPPLARALYASTEVGDEIPGNLFLAVARVLAYVFHLRKAQATDYIPRPAAIELPEEYADIMDKELNDGD